MSQVGLNFTPDYEQAFGLLKHLNSEELTQLLNNEEKLDSMVKDLQQVKIIETERELLIASNKSLSEFNLSQKPVLDDTRKQLQELYNMASELKNELLEKKTKMGQVKNVQSPDTILALLQTATAEIEDETEDYVNTFLDGDTPVKTFLEEYLKKRKLAHLRRAKSEKMAMLLQKPLSSNNPPARPPRPRQKPPAPAKPSVPSGPAFRTAGVPLPPNSSVPSFITTGIPPSAGPVGPSFWSTVSPPVVPTRPAPLPPQKLSLGNEVLQGLNKTHISGITSDTAKSSFPHDPSYVASCSQPIINLNARATPYPVYPGATPYPVYPGATPFTPCLPQRK